MVFAPKILAARPVSGGNVVYLGPNGLWVKSRESALRITDPLEAIDCLAEAEALTGFAADPHLVDAQ